MDIIGGDGAIHCYGFLCHQRGMDWLHAAHRGSAESYQSLCHTNLFCWRKDHRYLELQQRKPYPGWLYQIVTFVGAGTGRYWGCAFLWPFGHWFLCPGACCHQAWPDGAEECWRWIHYHAAVGQTVVFWKGIFYDGAPLPKAHWVGDCCQVGKELYEGWDHYDVPELLRFPT